VQVNDLYFAGTVLNCLSNVPAVDSASLDKNTKGNIREKMEKIEGLARRMRCENVELCRLQHRLTHGKGLAGLWLGYEHCGSGHNQMV
jgi:hypothetical protein